MRYAGAAGTVVKAGYGHELAGVTFMGNSEARPARIGSTRAGSPGAILAEGPPFVKRETDKQQARQCAAWMARCHASPPVIREFRPARQIATTKDGHHEPRGRRKHPQGL